MGGGGGDGCCWFVSYKEKEEGREASGEDFLCFCIKKSEQEAKAGWVDGRACAFSHDICARRSRFPDANVDRSVLRRHAENQRGWRGKAAKRLIAEGGLRRILQAPPAVSAAANPAARGGSLTEGEPRPACGLTRGREGGVRRRGAARTRGGAEAKQAKHE